MAEAVAAEVERDFTLEDLIHILTECRDMLKSVEEADPQDQYLVVYEVHQMFYSVVVKNTCLDLYSFNRVAKYYDVSHFPPEEWIRLLSQYCDAFLRDCKSEHEAYGNY